MAELTQPEEADFDAQVVWQSPARLQRRIGPWGVDVNRNCIDCGLCIEVCPASVFRVDPGRHHMAAPREHCLGPSCSLCVTECPVDAITISPSSDYAALGDSRWTNDLLDATFHAARYGALPDHTAARCDIGASGGGFDRLRFNFPEKVEPIALEEIDTSIPLNRRGKGREISISIPVYGGGMSFGSISLNVMLARAMAAKRLGTFTCTGEGGYPPPLFEYADHTITQVATGLFGVREETIQAAPIVEFKYAQGAKPGLGGHLLSDKVTRAVAHMREAVQGTSLFSPFPFHSVYSVEDHKKHADWIKTVNPRALIAVKVSTPEDVDMVAVGSYYAGAHIIHLDGAYGGTGAAPDIAKKNIAMPIEFAIPRAHRFLHKEGIRDEVTLMASGGIRTPHDVLKAIMLGADGCVIGTAELVALGCVRCGNCESGRGCPCGVATTDPELAPLIEAEWGAQRIVNMYAAWRREWVLLMQRLGVRSVSELRGRIDLLAYEEGG
jgi:glutamate synthase domain-containing protein 2/Pyruvate/2-oxoacid:ferredoxin oxidoreductase delta subunit